MPSPSPGPAHGLADVLQGVSASSASQAWAVGNTGCGCGPGGSLILRWNGAAWKQVPGPATRTAILRWNGGSWKRVPGPGPRGSADLAGVTAAGTRGTFAVGSTSTKGHTAFRSLILAWNGTDWK